VALTGAGVLTPGLPLQRVIVKVRPHLYATVRYIFPITYVQYGVCYFAVVNRTLTLLYHETKLCVLRKLRIQRKFIRTGSSQYWMCHRFSQTKTIKTTKVI